MKKILVIDDERDVLEVVRSVLKTKGYTVRCAEGGEEGLRQAESEAPDLIICDLMMPRISGLEVIKRLHANPRFDSTPIIVLSAVGEDSDKPTEFWARGLGVDDYITKPFDPLDLLGRVEFIFRRGSYKSLQDTEAQHAANGGQAAGRTPLPHAPTPKPVDLAALSPSELVKVYVDSWNIRDWETEYRCMDDSIMGHFPLDDYRLRREQAFAEEGGKRTQHVTEILEEYSVSDMGRVTCEREDNLGERTVRKRLTFSLKKRDGGWRILRFKEEPVRAKL
ncbi:MAG: two-component system, OmpR family, alkaline phosphatase synthesis response regulator PhoP [Candidatus Sumerlaeota bacterium]|nr:two-component system, OmpR family, alkaline phosphatase synthesis response regulator PhoP [Candidatus Sumerlaeota bacterium]